MGSLQQKLSDLPKSAQRKLRPNIGIDFCGNDYLGLSQHPRLKETVIQALQNGMPLGAAGARLIRGNQDTIIECEAFCADYFNSEAALFVESGFKANYLLLSTLPQRGEVIIYDERVHASIHEGIHASHAKRIKIPHNNLVAFEAALQRTAEAKQRAYIVVESLYSMDGDRAPLAEIFTLSKKYQATLIVDEAHAVGIFGNNGKGLTEDLPRENLITLYMGGKALGVSGAVICCSQNIKNQLINFARPFIFSTAPWPLQALAFQTALQIIADEQQRRSEYQRLMTTVASLLGNQIISPIIPIILGNDENAVAAAEKLQAQGYDIRAIRPPTVPLNTARLRLTVQLSQTLEQWQEVLIQLTNMQILR